jgi:LysR family transcriptional regulator, regulator of abg operon
VSVRVVTRRDSPLTPAATLLLDCLRHAAQTK